MQKILSGAEKVFHTWWKKALICLVLAAAAAVCLEWLQVKTQPIDYSKSWEGMRKISLLRLTAIFFPLFMLLFGIHGWKRFTGCLTQAKNGFMEDRKHSLACFLLFIVSGGLTYLVLWLYIPYILGKPFNRMMNVFVLAVSLAVGCGFCFRRTLGKKPEIFFLVICILMGGTIAVTEPAMMVSWDEPTHYSRAIEYSYLGQVRLTEEDHHLIEHYGEEPTDDLSKIDAWHARQDEFFHQGVVSRPLSSLTLNSFWYMFSGLGIYLGRVLGCSYYQIMALGRLFNLLAYAVIGYFAVRRLKYGKIILATVLLIPECLFLASNYSYDPGVTAFIALGLSYCFAEWQEPSEKMKFGNALIMTVSLFLGCLVKAIYFPVMFLPLFMRKDKFSSKSEHRRYIAILLAAMILLILSFVLPFASSDGAGDTRGGDDVNAFGQVEFILKNPLQYAGILFGFLGQYLNPQTFHGFLTHFAYLGTSPEWVLYLVLLAVLAFTDKNGADYGIPGKKASRWIILAILFVTMVLVATSMYVLFTPVGLETLNGCQPRYLLPLFFPAMMLIGSQKVVNKMNKTLYNGMAFSVIGYAGFSSILLMIVRSYY